jgi:hypothetical protein
MMSAKTATVILQAPCDEVFGFLSSVENLPEWATEFCQGLRVENGVHIATTPMGEMLIRYDVDKETGVIDIWAGSAEEWMALFPTRVIGLSDVTSAYIFTVFQAPDMSDDVLEDQYRSLLRELAGLERRFSTT